MSKSISSQAIDQQHSRSEAGGSQSGPRAADPGNSELLPPSGAEARAEVGDPRRESSDPLKLSPRQVLALGIVQVPQNHSLFPRMTVAENVRLGAYTVDDTMLVNRRLGEVEELFPIIKERARDKAGSLSGGQQRLVEFARSLMLDPTMVLLDEPSMGLDPKTLKQVFDTITLMRETGRTIVLVEQNARSGLRISTHGVVMESGRVHLEGTHTEILENPHIGELYLGGMISGATVS